MGNRINCYAWKEVPISESVFKSVEKLALAEKQRLVEKVI